MEKNNFNLKEFKIPFKYRGASVVQILLWDLTNKFLFKQTHRSMYEIRATILRLFGAKIGKNTKIRPSTKILYPWKLEIGEDSWVGDEVDLYNLENIHIGRNTCISQYCKLITGSHNFKSNDFEYRCESIYIGNNAWLTIDCMVLPGVKVEDGSYYPPRTLIKKLIQK